jgi:hypothetical protein
MVRLSGEEAVVRFRYFAFCSALAAAAALALLACADDEAPGAPTGVTATAGNGQVTISWGAVSGATGVTTGSPDNTGDAAADAGAVYVFTHSGSTWSQQAYVKASNTRASDQFGFAVALSGDGNTLAVGALEEDSAATGIGGNQADNGATNSGAAYLY